MQLGRRKFLAGAAGAAGSVVVVGCAAPERESRVQSFVLAPEQSLPGDSVWFATADAHSRFGNSVVVRTVDGRAKKVEGNPGFPINQGKTDVRAQAGVQSLYHPDRIKEPMIPAGTRGDGRYEVIGWERALDMLVSKLGAANSFQLITSRLTGTEAGVAAAFTELFGGRHLVHETVENTNFQAAVQKIFGASNTPHFDIGNAGVVLSFGADFLGTWGSPVMYSEAYRQLRGGERGRLTQIEPRMSLTGASADRWIYVKPGQEGALALSIAQVIVAEALVDNKIWREAVDAIGGVDVLNLYAPDVVTGRTGVPVSLIQTIAREFVERQPGLALAGGPSLAQTNGMDNGAAALFLNLVVGNVGRPGGVIPNPPAPGNIPFPLPATSFADWRSYTTGLAAGSAPDVMFVYDADPAFGISGTPTFTDALAGSPFVVGMSTFMNETVGIADLILPATHPFESWGDFAADPGPGVQVVGYQQPVAVTWTDARSFGDVLLTVAAEIKGEGALPWSSMHEAVRANAEELLGMAGTGPEFEPTWVELLRRGGAWKLQNTSKPFASVPDWDAGAMAEPEFAGDPESFEFHLIPFESVAIGTGDESENPWLQSVGDPLTTMTWITWAELNPKTAAALGVGTGDVVAIDVRYGTMEVPVFVSPVTPPDVVAVPVGRGRNFGGRWRRDRGENVFSVIDPAVDVKTGALAWASSRARVRKIGRTITMPMLERVANPRNDGPEPILEVKSE
jgi:molybdopterin-containing oxidoreductase family iron-sulfur binding subunit